ncbi:hypothetical protein HII36_46900 [Nonomuraea sp. NN258]|uniref:hypothetical protein n=1 Tax=Nonomuraea antri TaxID=2730852 RepID=UPI001568CEC1|nr:hypothetical protein [Nonomuraea antri]NRQ39303.1 hypothetical protein [Nonomuraea antri]
MNTETITEPDPAPEAGPDPGTASESGPDTGSAVGPEAGSEPGGEVAPAAGVPADTAGTAVAGRGRHGAPRRRVRLGRGWPAWPGWRGLPWRALRPRARIAVLTSVAVACCAGGLALQTARAASAGQVVTNPALLDATATARVTGDVSNALTKIFSYSPEELAATEQSAAEVLAGRAAEQYSRLFAQVEQDAVAQRATLTSRVARAGVIELSGDTARLLVFLDQTATRRGRVTGPPVAAQLTVTARLSGGHWRITEISSTEADR